jgi:dTDP-4-amino-4,6-dideoxygalactose transaminase
MYRIGQEEADAVARVIHSGKLFRYHEGGQCQQFEQRYAAALGVKHVGLTSSGTAALTAALAGLEIGPGDEVIVPAFTFMATAIAVLAVGAIPVIIDVDESLTLSPDALEAAIGPRTRAVIPVHMIGLPCDMRAVMRIARQRKLKVVEDACQAVGGAYEGRMLGSIGHAAAFSFNYYKNMTCGEGGAFATNTARVARRAECCIDPCRFYWKGRRGGGVRPFTSSGSRASEFDGAMLNVQLDRLPDMIRRMRDQKRRILSETADAGLMPAVTHSLDHECGSHTVFLLASAAKARAFAQAVGGVRPIDTGRHVYTEWDPILEKRGAFHEALNPFKLPANRRCRMRYARDMCPRSLDILGRAVMIANHPDRTEQDVTGLVERIRQAGRDGSKV